MRETSSRQGFGIADAMILVAATALALGWIEDPLDWHLTYPFESRASDILTQVQMIGTAMAATWGLGVLAMRLRPPRPVERDWKHGPGFVACIAATAACLCQFAIIMVWYVVRGQPLWPGRDILGALLDPAASAVLGSWLALALAGLWNREKTWMDDLGIGVGLTWFVLWVIRIVSLCA